MALKLMYITNNPQIAIIAERAGVDRIFVDMEYIGKEQRQKGIDSVKNHHTIDDVSKIKAVLTQSQLLVRVNPIHHNTEKEIENAISAGADVLMLPFFKSTNEVDVFLKCVGTRCKKMLLLETPEAVEILDDILKMDGIDEIHIGINDLSMGYGKKFMFELLADGTIDKICDKLKGHVPYGFGGIASLGNGLLKAEYIISEHYRLGSSMAILSRSFCNPNDEIEKIEDIFSKEIIKIRLYEKECAEHPEKYEENRVVTNSIIRSIIKK